MMNFHFKTSSCFGYGSFYTLVADPTGAVSVKILVIFAL